MTKRMLLLASLVLALGVGLAACGGDDDETTAAETTAEQADGMEGASAGNIVAVAQETPDLSTLVDAVVAAELVETLEGPGPFTVFAPTNAAFEGLGETLEALLEPANQAELAEILEYHVVAGELSASELSDGQMLETVQGGSLEVAISEDGEVTVNGATVAIPDVEASNGIVHVIDEVLTPQG